MAIRQPPPTAPSLAQRLIWLFARFDGRISRQVYWLANLQLVVFLLILLRPMIPISFDEETGAPVIGELPAAAGFIVLLTTVSTLAIGAKRLHDFGASGFFAAALLLFPISAVATIVIGVIPGTAGPNRHGDGPDRVPGRRGTT